MTVARTNPLAPGVYWIDVVRPFGSSTVPDNDPKFRAWLDASPSVELLRRTADETVVRAEENGENRDRLLVFYAFEVTSSSVPPAPFPFRELGFPTIKKLAGEAGGVTVEDRNVQQGDTEQKPEPRGLGDELADAASTAKDVGGPVLAVVGLGLAAYILKTALDLARGK